MNDLLRWATKCATLAVRSKERPLTLMEIGAEIGYAVSHDDLVSMARVCRTWNIRTNIDGDCATWDAAQRD